MITNPWMYPPNAWNACAVSRSDSPISRNSRSANSIGRIDSTDRTGPRSSANSRMTSGCALRSRRHERAARRHVSAQSRPGSGNSNSAITRSQIPSRMSSLPVTWLASCP